jgi:hypothetical protein
MSELMNSRCKDCSPKAYQCSACASNDVTVRKAARLAKKMQLQHQGTKLFPTVVDIVLTSVVSPQLPNPVTFASVNTLPPVSPGLVSEFPSMPPPAPLFAYGQQLFPEAVDASTFMNVEARPFTPLSKRLRDHDELSLTSSFSSDSECDAEGSAISTADDEEAEVSSKQNDKTKTKMTRITKEERNVVCVWITNDRPDGKMTNGRWIRNGGAKGATMTATSGEVKTSGAYDSLAT